MPLPSPEMPNFSVQPPQLQSPLDSYGRMLQLKALSGEQQLLPLRLQSAQQDVQAKQLQNQNMQAEIQSRKGLMDAITGGVFNKYAGVETPDGSGFDAAGALKDLVANHHVLPDQAMTQVQSLLAVSKNQAEIAKANAEAGSAQQNIRVKTLESVAAKLGSIQDMPAADAIKALDAFKQNLAQNQKAFQGLTPDEFTHLSQMDLEHLPAVEALMGLEGKIADFHKSKFEALKAGSEAGSAAYKRSQEEVAAAGGLTDETRQGIKKDVAVATNPAVQKGKEDVAAAEGAALAQRQIQNKRQETVDQQYLTAGGADERLNRMEHSYKDAVNGNQQSMLALLSDHIGMTMGLQKGARITKDIIHEAQQSQPFLASIQAKFSKDGYLSGVTLSPNQMKQMLDLGYSARENAWGNANSMAKMYGVQPPPNAQQVYAQRDPNKRVYNAPAIPQGAVHIGVSSLDGKKYYLDAQGKKLGPAE